MKRSLCYLVFVICAIKSPEVMTSGNRALCLCLKCLRNVPVIMLMEGHMCDDNCVFIVDVLIEYLSPFTCKMYVMWAN